jgi:opacity protein-like surface antigen
MYGELCYTFLNMHAQGATFSPGALRGIFGYDFHPSFAVEGMLGGNVANDSGTVTINGITTSTSAKMDYMYGIWVKPKYLYNQAELFARLGWAHTKLELSPAGFSSRSESHDDFAWGLGANFRFNPNAYVGLDWMRYSNQSDKRVDGWTLSVGWHW